jgi:hypothetical protein
MAARTIAHPNYGRMHLSCHGNPEEVCLTIDTVPFAEFGEEIRNYLTDRKNGNIEHVFGDQLFLNLRVKSNVIRKSLIFGLELRLLAPPPHRTHSARLNKTFDAMTRCSLGQVFIDDAKHVTGNRQMLERFAHTQIGFGRLRLPRGGWQGTLIARPS